MQFGIDRLIANPKLRAPLAGKRVALLANPASVTADLTHSLDAEAMLKQFLLLLRELIGINRAAVFLRQPAHWLGEKLALDENRRLRAACALGLSPGLLQSDCIFQQLHGVHLTHSIVKLSGGSPCCARIHICR